MGRPREHNDQTAAALLAAAEQAIQEHGPDSLSVRGLARECGTTTRAVYSLFGSRDGLIAALAAHGFELLGGGVAQLPTTPGPRRDLVEAGLVFRRFALEHPALFRIAFQTDPSPLRTIPSVRLAATAAFEVLKRRIARLDDSEALNGDGVSDAALQFHAVCEGLAGLELRGTLPAGAGERIWREGLSALVRGLPRPQ